MSMIRALMNRGNRAPFELVDVHREVNNVFDEISRMTGNLMRRDPFFSTIGRAGFPKVNVRRDNEDCILEVAIPYYDPDSVAVSLKDGVLTVSAKAVGERVEYEVQEVAKREFSRSWPVGENIKKEDISAEYEKGVLFVRVKGQYAVTKVEEREPELIVVKKKTL